MKKSNLTVTPELLELLKIKNINELTFYSVDFREIFEVLESANFTPKGKHSIHSFKGYLDRMEETYGSWAILAYWYNSLTEYLYEVDGTYVHQFGNELLTNNICQEIDADEPFDLDLLKEYGDRIANFLADAGDSSIARQLNNHFKSIQIFVDNRETFSKKDGKVFDDTLEKFLEKMSNILDVELPEIDERQFDYETLVFKNPRFEEVRNIEELQDKNDELRNLLSESNVGELLAQEFTVISRDVLNDPTLTIELYVCSTEPHKFKISESQRYFSDMSGHPKYVVDEFLKTVERCNNDKMCKKLIVETDSENILNTIQYMVFKGEARLANNKFKYTDHLNKEYAISITKDGKYEPEFPKGFFDVTIDKVFEMTIKKI